MDRIFSAQHYLKPELRKGYALLIHYYQNTGNLNAQLYYLNQLLEADRHIEKSFKSLSTSIHKEYDEIKILREKREIENKLSSAKRIKGFLLLLVAALFFISLFFSGRYYLSRRLYRQRFEELIQQRKTGKTEENKTLSEMEIKADISANLLKKLEKFEREKKFLTGQWTLVKLAAYFDSNTKYLSSIIQKHKGKRFTDYLNGLKVDYIIGRLQQERKLRNYTQKALAEESGFSTAERLANAFKTKTGISLAFFIKELARFENDNTQV